MSYRALCLDSWFSKWLPDKTLGGAERAALSVAQALNADLFTPECEMKEIDGVRIQPSFVKPRQDWEQDNATISRAAAKLREEEILQLVQREKYDLVWNNSSSASHVAALRRLREKTGVAVVNYCHLSFAVSSFPRFSLLTELWKLKASGGINVATALTILDQAAEMIAKKGDLINAEGQPFDYWMAPCTLEHVPEPNPIIGRRDKIFALTRFASDKNAGQLAKILVGAAKSGIPVEAHFAPGDMPDEMEKCVADLNNHGSIGRISVPQIESFHAAETALVHVTASHTECYGIAPCEMAALGVPTAFVEKGHPHVLRSILGDFCAPIPKNGDLTEIINWASSFGETERDAHATKIRMKHTAEKFATRAHRIATDAILRAARSPNMRIDDVIGL